MRVPPNGTCAYAPALRPIATAIQKIDLRTFIRLTLSDKFARRWIAAKLAIFKHFASAAVCYLYFAENLHTRIRRDLVSMKDERRIDRELCVRVPNHEVGVISGLQFPFAGTKVRKARRLFGHEPRQVL